MEERMEIKVTLAETNRTRPNDSELGFGTVFTDHMFVMDYSVDKGWHNPEIKPHSDFSMPPSAMVLHYGQAICARQTERAYIRHRGSGTVGTGQEIFMLDST